MARVRRAVFLLLLPALACGSYANIKGICNHYKSTVRFTNTECSGNNCDAGPDNGNCDAKRAFIPKCEDPTKYGKHHMQVRSDDGHVDIKLWKSDNTKKIRCGTDYATAKDCANEVSKGEWNIVINPDGGVYLYLTSDPANCPAAPVACTAKNIKGSWQYKYMVSAAITETWKHGTVKTHSESKTKEWSSSVTVKVKEGFELDGASSSVEVDTTIGTKVSQTYSDEWSTSDEHDFSVTFQGTDIGKAAWQFHFDETDSCNHVESTLTREFALTPNEATQPCCVPGFVTDAPRYTTCTSKDALVPGVSGCKVGTQAAVVV